MDDFYKILGVSPSASKEEIKKVYRKLALTFHPDRNKGDKAAEKKFKTITEAYFVLSDEKRRQEYDQMRKFGGGNAGGFGNFRGGYSGDFNSIFEEILRSSGGRGRARTSDRNNSSDFFSDLFGSRGSGEHSNKSKVGSDAEAQLTLNFFEAIGGCKKEIQLNVEGVCAECGGSGSKKNLINRRIKCDMCGGMGKVMTEENLTVTIPSGVETGSIIRLRGKGQAGKNGGLNGNLLIEIKVDEDSNFRRQGDDLYLEIPISLEEALLGAAIKIPTGSGAVTLKIQPSSTGKKKLRLPGKGVTNGKTHHKGDLIASLKIVLPESMTEEAKNLLLRFSKLQPTHPRPNWIS